MKQNEKNIELKVGFFVLIGITLALVSIVVLGGKQSMFTSTKQYVANFDRIDGLVEGAKVVLGGLFIGVVDKVDLDKESKQVVVEFSVEKKYTQWVRQDSSVEILTQGVLGDKYLSLNAGSMEHPELPEHSAITVGPSQDLSQLFSSSEQLMNNLSAAAKNLDRVLMAFDQNGRAARIFEGVAQSAHNTQIITKKLSEELDGAKIKSTINQLNSILEKINHGQGSLGAIVNDPALYDDLKALVGQVNRNRIYRNLIRQTIQDNKDNTKQ